MYEELIDDVEEALHDQKDTKDTSLHVYKHRLEMCNAPADSLESPTTTNEVEALDRLWYKNCQHSPRLIGTSEGTVRPGLHHEAIVGGYSVLILMNKLPGKTLSMDMFCKMPLEERQSVREAFKEAWL